MPLQATAVESDPLAESTAKRDPAKDTNVRDPAVAVDGLQKVYGSDDAVRVVDDISFAVEQGTAVGLLGPNGAGKTTTIKMLLGLVVPTSGRARVGGVDVHEDERAAYRRVGAMLEGARNVYWRLTVRENLRFFAAIAGQHPSAVRDRHDELLDQFGLSEKADTPVQELSQGMKQKVSLACTLTRNADVVFLDEPTLGLDVESSLELRAELHRLVDDDGMTVVLSSHDMDVIEDICDRVIIMNEGCIVADDTVENLLDLFRTQTYEVRLNGLLSETIRHSLQTEFSAADFERCDESERFHAQVIGDEFYALSDALREAGVTVTSIEAVEPDLEDVFLHITDGDHEGDGT
ncbi:ABC transporter ATP-binding protein [Haladaptatus halobius]|uniref:ABC transporter ATP-binding protein n=1 Tax=Haladaptatus halobius TaxID=2884875 RepID=UPI001D0B5168|nr:ABC transporter ATP-binding protein [Haladaptatus halobius]